MIEFVGALILSSAAAHVLKGPVNRWLAQNRIQNPKQVLAIGRAALTARIQSLFNDKQLVRIGKQLEKAGVSKDRAMNFLVVRIVTFLTLLLLCLSAVAFGAPWLLVLTVPLAGFFYPSFRLQKTIDRRQREIILSLPFYFDILTLALEAGLDLIAALEELVTRDSRNALRDEFAIVLKSNRMGESRSQAFRNLADRTGVEALSLLSSCITQSEELGASLGGLLRLQSENLRREIFKDAEIRAQKAPVKMLAPLIGLIFPVLFLLLFSPIALKLFGQGQ